MHIASVTSVIPIPALCLKPRAGSISELSERGRMHPAATISFPLIIIAPSCKGEGGVNMVTIKGAETSAFIYTPPFSIYSLRPSFLSIAINAPNPLSLNVKDAATISSTIPSTSLLLSPKKYLIIGVLPKSDNALLISG